MPFHVGACVQACLYLVTSPKAGSLPVRGQDHQGAKLPALRCSWAVTSVKGGLDLLILRARSPAHKDQCSDILAPAGGKVGLYYT